MEGLSRILMFLNLGFLECRKAKKASFRKLLERDLEFSACANVNPFAEAIIISIST